MKEIKNPIADEKKDTWGDASSRVNRGGCWGDYPGYVRVSTRNNRYALADPDVIGFRIVRNQK